MSRKTEFDSLRKSISESGVLYEEAFYSQIDYVESVSVACTRYLAVNMHQQQKEINKLKKEPLAETFHPQEAQKKNSVANEVVAEVRCINAPTTTDSVKHALDKVKGKQVVEFTCDGCSKFIEEGEKMWNINLHQEVWEDGAITVLDAYAVFIFCEKCAAKKDFERITVPDKE